MNWDKNYDVGALLSRLHLLRHSLDSELYMPVLVSAAKFDESIPEAERLAIIRRGVASVLSQPSPNPQALLAAIAQEQAAYFRQAEQEMVLLASISIMTQVGLRPRTLEGSKLFFSKSVPNAFRSPWLKQNSELHEV